MTTIDTDYLIVGAGVAGMGVCRRADRRVGRRCGGGGPARPGGRSLERRLPLRAPAHASAFYGVNSRVLGSDSIEEGGPEVGWYGRASVPEICDYYQRVLEEHLLASGRVRFFGMCDYRGDWSGEHQLRRHDAATEG